MVKKVKKAEQSRCVIRYKTLVKIGSIDLDKAQLVILERLDAILNLIEPAPSTYHFTDVRFWIYRIFKARNISGELGLYLHGGVGTGKSMLMDIFFHEIRSKRKLRTHFHSFMQETHESINNARLDGSTDPIGVVASEISKEVSVLCFDEFQISDITDAMLVGRLFSVLISRGTFIVTTSNRPPDDLYKDGLNRKLFLPFIELLKDRLHVIELTGLKDYRREKLFASQIYFEPINDFNRQAFDKIWRSLVVEAANVLEIRIKGRIVKLARYSNGVGRGSFDDLCGCPLGALDYLIICEHIKVLFIEDIPVLSPMKMDSAKRFVTLIDTLYENRIKIICLAEQKPEMLYASGKGSFEVERTISRLYEMQSEEWITGIDT